MMPAWHPVRSVVTARRCTLPRSVPIALLSGNWYPCRWVGAITLDFYSSTLGNWYPCQAGFGWVSAITLTSTAEPSCQSS
jgi:hypothetical protein